MRELEEGNINAQRSSPMIFAWRNLDNEKIKNTEDHKTLNKIQAELSKMFGSIGTARNAVLYMDLQFDISEVLNPLPLDTGNE